MKKLFSNIFFGIILVLFGMWIKDPFISFIRHRSSEVPMLRKILDFSSVRIEPKTINFKKEGAFVLKSFKLINDSNRPIYRFRAFVTSDNSPLEDIDISIFQDYQVTANEFDSQKHMTCNIYQIQTNSGIEGKLINIYKIPEGKELDFYIKARGRTTINFKPVEWSPEESGVVFNDDGSTETQLFYTSNLGSDEGKVEIDGVHKGMKVMLFKYL